MLDLAQTASHCRTDLKTTREFNVKINGYFLESIFYKNRHFYKNKINRINILLEGVIQVGDECGSGGFVIFGRGTDFL